MNLIYEEWIPVQKADGTTDKIAPYQVTKDSEDGNQRIIAVASPRSDFDGALTQFLIGLFQTACSPVTELRWWKWRESKIYPKPDALRDLLSKYDKAFNLDSQRSLENEGKNQEKEKIRLFMQEDFGASKSAKPHPVSYLLIGAATDNALKTNTDLFVKRQHRDFAICPHCAAAALYTLQTFAPSGGGGGEGKFTSIRGGGPLTTLVLGETLWETIWLNVVIQDFAAVPMDEKTFPWLRVEAYITENQPVKEIHSDSMNPAHVFWGMPRRIQLRFEENRSESCGICGNGSELICREYLDRSGGLTYQPKKGSQKIHSWVKPPHPQTPHRAGADNRPTPIHPRPGGIGYRHWLGLVYSLSYGDNKALPAKVIEQFRTFRETDGRFWAFGYDMENMKARCWYDSRMPLLNVNDTIRDIFSEGVLNMLSAARYVSGQVLQAVVRATMLDPEKNELTGEISWEWPKSLLNKLRKTPTEKTDAIKEKVKFGEDLENRIEANMISLLDGIRSEFWNSTEGPFFQHLYDLRERLIESGDEKGVLENWRLLLRREAFRIFDTYSQTGDFDAADPRRVSLAWMELLRNLDGKLVYDKLGLPWPKASAPAQP